MLKRSSNGPELLNEYSKISETDTQLMFSFGITRLEFLEKLTQQQKATLLETINLPEINAARQELEERATSHMEHVQNVEFICKIFFTLDAEREENNERVIDKLKFLEFIKNPEKESTELNTTSDELNQYELSSNDQPIPTDENAKSNDKKKKGSCCSFFTLKKKHPPSNPDFILDLSSESDLNLSETSKASPSEK